MSDPIDVAIQAALLVYLKAGSYGGVPISYPFVAFTPPKDGSGNGLPYLDARNMLRATPNSPGMAFTGSTIRTGIFQVDAVVPDGQGEAPGLRLAALVAARFPQGLSTLVANTSRIQFNKTPSIAAAVKDAPWIRFPVSIPYLVIS